MARGSPLPLAGDGSARFLPWLVALMVFLAAIAVAAAATIGSGLEQWDSGLRGTLTVQLPPPAEGPANAPAALPVDRVQAALDEIRQTQGVTAAAEISPAETARLIGPWLGDLDPALLPLPVMIDLHVSPDGFDRASLETRLGSIVPGATVLQHAAWLDRFFIAARVIEGAIAAVVLLVIAIAAAAVVFTTRTGLMLYAPLIDLLHLMGATDAYIALQFQAHAFRLAVKGGLFGLVMSLLAFGAFRLLLERGGDIADAAFLPGYHLPLAGAAGVVVLPLIMGFVGLITARMTVLSALSRLP